MGTSTNGILVYGYHLGGEDCGWDIEEVGPDGVWRPAWSTPDEDGYQDLIGDAEWALLGSVGFTERNDRSDSYYERRRQALELVGVELTKFASDVSPMWLLSAHTITVRRGRMATVDFAALDTTCAREDWDGKLARAAAALGVTPRQRQPKWLLTSYWSE